MDEAGSVLRHTGNSIVALHGDDAATIEADVRKMVAS